MNSQPTAAAYVSSPMLSACCVLLHVNHTIAQQYNNVVRRIIVPTFQRRKQVQRDGGICSEHNSSAPKLGHPCIKLLHMLGLTPASTPPKDKELTTCQSNPSHV